MVNALFSSSSFLVHFIREFSWILRIIDHRNAQTNIAKHHFFCESGTVSSQAPRLSITSWRNMSCYVFDMFANVESSLAVCEQLASNQRCMLHLICIPNSTAVGVKELPFNTTQRFTITLGQIQVWSVIWCLGNKKLNMFPPTDISTMNSDEVLSNGFADYRQIAHNSFHSNITWRWPGLVWFLDLSLCSQHLLKSLIILWAGSSVIWSLKFQGLTHE